MKTVNIYRPIGVAIIVISTVLLLEIITHPGKSEPHIHKERDLSMQNWHVSSVEYHVSGSTS
jgi:hypothetical protein